VLVSSCLYDTQDNCDIIKLLTTWFSKIAAPTTSQVSWTMIPTITAVGAGRSLSGTTLTVCKGDSVRFYWGTVHGVAETTAANWKTCSLAKFKNMIGVAMTADKTLKMNKPGTRYVYCQVPGHCGQGQKMKIVTKSTAC
jgi:hypothetical protein